MFCKHVCCEEERKKERKKKKIILFFSLSFLLHSPPKYFCHLEGLTPLVVGIIETHKTSGVVIIIFSEEERKKMGGEGGA